MNHLQKHFSASLIALAALLSTAPMAWAATAPDLGTASLFSVLGGTNVTCTTAGVIGGDVGVSPGSADPFTNTGCTIAGGMPPATNTAAVGAQLALTSAYDAARALTCPSDNVLGSTIGTRTLFPGVYCTGAALTVSGVLTLDAQNDPNAFWVFQVGTTATGALSGTDFTVTMINGGQPCNVFWAPSADVTFTTSAMKGNILAGNPLAAGGSITLNYGTLAGRALANVAVTMTGANVFGCGALSGPVTPGTPPGSSFCKDHEGHHYGHDKDKDHKKCNQGVGNGHEDCDPGNSNNNPWGSSNDEDGGTRGNPGRKGDHR